MLQIGDVAYPIIPWFYYPFKVKKDELPQAKHVGIFFNHPQQWQ